MMNEPVDMIEPIDPEKQKVIFLKLVEEQDAGTGVDQSRQRVSEEFGIQVTQVREIEKEGLSQKWPPLS